MSQLGIFHDFDEDTIKSIQAKAIDLVMSGNPIMSWQGEGTQAERKFAMPPKDVLEECRFSLKEVYPSTNNGHRITRTKARMI